MSSRAPRSPRGQAPRSPWDPLRDLLVLKDRMNHLFENVLRKGGDLAKGEIAGWCPAVDLREDSEEFVLTAEIPGVPRENISIRLEHGTLTLKGQRPLEAIPEADHLRVERSYGPFSRSFHLPAPIDAPKARARFHRGVLEVYLPKSAQAHSVPVEVPIG